MVIKAGSLILSCILCKLNEYVDVHVVLGKVDDESRRLIEKSVCGLIKLSDK